VAKIHFFLDPTINNAFFLTHKSKQQKLFFILSSQN